MCLSSQRRGRKTQPKAARQRRARVDRTRRGSHGQILRARISRGQTVHHSCGAQIFVLVLCNGIWSIHLLATFQFFAPEQCAYRLLQEAVCATAPGSRWQGRRRGGPRARPKGIFFAPFFLCFVLHVPTGFFRRREEERIPQDTYQIIKKSSPWTTIYTGRAMWARILTGQIIHNSHGAQIFVLV